MGLGLVRRREHLEPDRAALVDQAGVAPHLVTGAPLGDLTRHLAEDPGGLARPGQAGVVRRAGQGDVELGAQRRLQVPEVLAARLLTAVLAQHAIGRAQVRGALERSQASRGTTMPTLERTHRSRASSSGSSPAGRRPGTRGPCRGRGPG